MSSSHLPKPAQWGPHFWYVLKIVALSYGDQPSPTLRAEAVAFYSSLVKMLPCPDCRKHFKALLEEHPVENALENTDSLIAWVETMEVKVKDIIETSSKDKAPLDGETADEFEDRDGKSVVQPPLPKYLRLRDVATGSDQVRHGLHASLGGISPPVSNIMQRRPARSAPARQARRPNPRTAPRKTRAPIKQRVAVSRFTPSRGQQARAPASRAASRSANRSGGSFTVRGKSYPNTAKGRLAQAKSTYRRPCSCGR